MSVMSKLGLAGPKRTAVEQKDGYWLVAVTPPVWSGFDSTSTITLSADQYRRYTQWLETGSMIQDALPELSPSQREILLSGIGPAAWDEKFAEED